MARKNKKTSTPTIPDAKQTNSVTWVNPKEFCYQYNSEIRVYPLHLRQQLAERVIHYCKNNSRCVTMEKALIEEGISKMTWHRWCQEEEWLQHVHDFCLMILAAKREEGGLFKEMDKDIVLKSMHHYNSDWKEIDAYNDERQSKNNEQATITTASVLFNLIGERPKKESDEVPK